MAEQRIRPESITRPIQLLAAWLTGLVLIDGTFLTAASIITEPFWLPSTLVIASVANVPLFLASIFVLQTKFRPEMQEDPYYSEYLQRQYSEGDETITEVDIEEYSHHLADAIVNEIGPEIENRRENIETVVREAKIEEMVRRFGDSRTLSELYLRPEIWNDVVEFWSGFDSFKEDLDKLRAEGLVYVPGDDLKEATLTQLGDKVADKAKDNGLLFAQKEEEYWKHEGKSVQNNSVVE